MKNTRNKILDVNFSLKKTKINSKKYFLKILNNLNIKVLNFLKKYQEILKYYIYKNSKFYSIKKST